MTETTKDEALKVARDALNDVECALLIFEEIELVDQCRTALRQIDEALK